MLMDKVSGNSINQVERAADIIDGALRFQEIIVEESLPCDIEKDCPLCMKPVHTDIFHSKSS